VKSIFDKEFSQKKVSFMPHRISIDKFSHRKGFRQYATVICDLETRNLLEVIDSHKQEEIATELMQWSSVERSSFE